MNFNDNDNKDSSSDEKDIDNILPDEQKTEENVGNEKPSDNIENTSDLPDNKDENANSVSSKLESVNSQSVSHPYINDITENLHEEKNAQKYQQPTNESYNQQYTPYNTTYNNVNQNAIPKYQPPEKNKPNDYKWNFSEYNQLENSSDNGNIKKKTTNIPLVLIGVVGVIVIGLLLYTTIFQNKDVTTTPDPNEEIKENVESYIKYAEEHEIDGGLSASEIHEKVSPSVVGIQGYDYENYGSVAIAEGSGVVMSNDGHIITNAHVVTYQNESGEYVTIESIKVSFLDGNSYSAKVLGADVRTDLAVLLLEKIPENIAVAEFGDSTQIKIGERVVAIGNPGGLNYAGTTTQGIVSNVNIKIDPNSTSTGFDIPAIQVDAAINPGNSGGALINRFGHVVGITSSKIAGVYYEGMGFAIPINEAKKILEDLIINGRVTGRPAIGIEYYPSHFIDSVIAEKHNLKTGIIVASINETSDAYAKGLMIKDIIHKIDGYTLESPEDVAEALGGKKAGDTIEIVVYRLEEGTNVGPGEELIFQIELMESKG